MIQTRMSASAGRAYYDKKTAARQWFPYGNDIPRIPYSHAREISIS